MIGEKISFEAVPKNRVGAEMTSGSRQFQLAASIHRKRTIPNRWLPFTSDN